MTQKIQAFSQRIDSMIIRELLIKLIIVVPIFSLIPAYVLNGDIISETLTLFILNLMQPTKYTVDFASDMAEILAYFLMFLFVVTIVLASLFIMSFRTTWSDFWKFSRRLYRAFNLSIFLIISAIVFLSIGLYLAVVDEPSLGLFTFLADLSSGLGTEVLGAFLLFLLLEVFAKTWEENEEAEYAEQRNSLNDTHKQLEAVLVRWQQSKLECNNQAKQQSEKSIFSRLLSPQTMPSAYYEGQAHALDLVIKDIQNLMPELDTPASDNSDKII